MNRRLALAVAALVLLGACGTRVKQWPDGALEPTDYYTTTATTLSLGSDDDTDPDGETNTTATTAAKEKRGGGSTATTVASGELPAPAPGTYTYDETGTFDGEQEKKTTTQRWAVERSATSVKLTMTETEDDGEFKSTSVSTFRVRSSALELLQTTVAYDDEAPDTCTYEPPVVMLKLPLAVGAKWNAKSRCGDDEAEDIAFEVTGTANDVIGGKMVKTFLVRATDSYDTTDDTTGERTTFSYTDIRHVDPATLLTVVEDATFSFDGDDSKVHRQLRSLTPA